MGFERIPPRLTELLGGLHWNPPLPSTPVKPQTPASKVPSEQLVEKISVNFAAAGATIAKLLQGPGRNPRLRRKVLGWITSEAVDPGPYAQLPEPLKQQMKQAITDLLYDAPNILV